MMLRSSWIWKKLTMFFTITWKSSVSSGRIFWNAAKMFSVFEKAVCSITMKLRDLSSMLCFMTRLHQENGGQMRIMITA